MDIENLSFSQLFVGFNDSELQDMIDVSQEKHFKTGETIVFEGEMGKSIFLIVSGKVNIVKRSRDGKKQILLNTIGEGDFFGEMSIIEIETRVATVVAKNDTVCLEFPIDVVKKYFSKKPETFTLFLMNIARILSKRLRKLSTELSTFNSIENLAKEKSSLKQMGSTENLVNLILQADISVQVKIWQMLTEKLSNFVL